MPTLTETIKQEALGLGFDTVGVARVEEKTLATSETIESRVSGEPLNHRLYTLLLEWIRQGFHGTMEWMARDPARRSNPLTILPGCRSVISLGMNYYTEFQADEHIGFGRIARYAWGEDYHRIFKKRLKDLEKSILCLAPEAQTRSYVDTGPIMEKAWAQEAGLGWIGKHSNLVSPEFGSWLLLGEVLTNLELDLDDPGTDLCGSCTLCLQACPTGAITEPYVVDAEKCLSYLTIEFRGKEEEIPLNIRKKVGNHIFGCDDCLDICPYNINAKPTTEPAFHPSPVTQSPNLQSLSRMKEKDFLSTFQKSAIRRAKYQGFLRNIRLVKAVEEGKRHLTSSAR